MILGFISDIHEDIVSLKKALALLEKENCDKIACLGDIIGFSALYYPYSNTRDANACIEHVRDYCSYVVAGNHDLFSAGKVPHNKAGVSYPDEWFTMDVTERTQLMNGRIWLYESEILPELSDANKLYLMSLPEYETISIDGIDILVTHFLYPDLSGSLRKRIDDICDYRSHFSFMRQNNCILSFAGHMHKEGFELVNGSGYHEYGFKRKLIRKAETFIGLPAVANGSNKNGTAIFNTLTFEFRALRL